MRRLALVFCLVTYRELMILGRPEFQRKVSSLTWPLSYGAHKNTFGGVMISRITSAILLSFAVSICNAQVATGLPQFGTFDSDQLVTINLSNLNIHLAIPLVSSSARGLKIAPPLVMDSSIRKTPNGTGYLFRLPYSPLEEDDFEVYLSQSIVDTFTCGFPPTTYNKYKVDGFYDGSNTLHSLGPFFISSPGNCQWPTSGSGVTNDGWLVNFSYAGLPNADFLRDPAGRTYTRLQSITDPNGNQLSLILNAGSHSWQDASGNTFLSTNCPLITSYQVGSCTYTYTGSGSAQEQITLSVGIPNTGLDSSYCVSPSHGGLYSSYPALTKITLADGSYYAISYEPTPGEPGYITDRLGALRLPTGGTISFNYGSYGINCLDGSTAGFTKTTPDGTWTYTHSITGSLGTTRVTAPDGSYIVYTFFNGFETQHISYDSSGATLQKVITCYNGVFTNCSSSTNATYVGQTDVYTYPGTSSSPSLVETRYSNGFVTEIKTYDYGATMPPASTFVADRTVTYGTYSSGVCNAIGNNITNRICTDTTVDNAGNLLAKARNTYDSHGNLITEQHSTSGSTYETRTYTYFSSGLVNVVTDVNGTQTTTAYGSCNNSFPTQTTVTANGVTLSTSSMTWDCTGEVPTSATDANGSTTTFGYVNQSGVPDPLWRLLSSTDSLGNTTWNTFSSGGAVPQTAETYMLFNGGASTVDKLTTLDTLGRPILQQVRQAPGSANFDTVATTYNPNAHVASIGVACVSTASTACSSPVTTTTYDALGRPLQITDGGGKYTTYTYGPGGAVKDVLVTVGPAATGETVKKRQLEYDGLGRLTSVCEITTLPGGGTCGQNNPLTGYWTKYAYDGLDHLIRVDQNAQGSPIQTRTLSYDSLGRLTSESNPEAGVTSYTFDMDSTCGASMGDLVKLLDANGNTRCYTYDALHRVTSTTYAGPNSTGVNR